MDTVRERTTPAVKDHERGLVQPWFDLTGLDDTSPQWRAVWNALVAADLAGEHGLILQPMDHEGPVMEATETTAARTVRLALEAGAACGLPHVSRPAMAAGGDRMLPVTPSLGVEMVLGLLHRDPTLFRDVLDRQSRPGVQRILEAVHDRVLGVYVDAPAALAAQIARRRSEATRRNPDGSAPTAWPPLVEVILRAAVTDEVFAEHVLLQLRDAPDEPTDFVVLPSGGWMIFGPDPVAANELRSSGNLLD